MFKYKYGIVIGKNIVAVAIKAGSLVGFFIPFAKHTGGRDIQAILNVDLDKIIELYPPKSVRMKKEFKPDRVHPMFFGIVYGAILSMAKYRNILVSEIDIRDVYKELGLPVARDALRKKFGKKTVLFPALYDKAMDSNLTKADKFTLVEAIALLESTEGR